MSAPQIPKLAARLAYLGVRTKQIDQWDRFARRVLGLHVEPLADGTLRLRLDQKLSRVLVEPGQTEGAAYYGWELPEEIGMETAAAALRAQGLAPRAGSSAERLVRGVEDFVWFHDPLGNRVELCSGHANTAAPLRFERPLSGFKTGKLGLGHVVITGAEVEPVRRFYSDILGMRLSDYTAEPFDAQFFHINPRHHSFAIIRNPREGLHHLMLELLELDDVGQTYDLLDREGVRLGATLGRHSNDHMTSFYMFTPSEFMIEWGWGGREIDVDAWVAERLDCGPSLWGHERAWLDPATRRQAADLRTAAAQNGLKAKVVVTPGRYVEASKEDRT